MGKNQEEITSTSAYLEFNNKIIEHQTKEYVSVRHYDAYYFLAKSFFEKSEIQNIKKLMELISRIRDQSFFSDICWRTFWFGLFWNWSWVICFQKWLHESRVIRFYNKYITVDFGVVDRNGNVYFGTENRKSSEQLYALKKKDTLLIKINGIETSMNGYSFWSEHSFNKIVIDSKNNVHIKA